jgi:hypothetical protein
VLAVYMANFAPRSRTPQQHPPEIVPRQVAEGGF